MWSAPPEKEKRASERGAQSAISEQVPHCQIWTEQDFAILWGRSGSGVELNNTVFMVLGLTFVLCTAVTPPHPRVVLSIGATAPWSHDCAVEAAALLFASHGSRAVWTFWQKWADQSCAEPDQLGCALRASALVVSSLAQRSLGAALVAHVQAPRVEAWAQLAEELRGVGGRAVDKEPCWWVSCGEFHSTLSAAAAAAASADCQGQAAVSSDLSRADPELSEALHALDHTLQGSTAAPVVLHVYIDPHREGLAECLAAVEEGFLGPSKESALPATAALALRYRPNKASASVPLSGFGAELVVKSTEYTVVDDRKDESGASEVDEEDEEDEASGRKRDDSDPSWWLRKRATEPVSLDRRCPRSSQGRLEGVI